MAKKTLPQYNTEFEQKTFKIGANVFRALLHPLRQKMLHLMQAKGQIKVTEIYRTMDLEQSVASQHLAILRRANLCQTERNGKEINYSVKPLHVSAALSFCEKWKELNS